MSNTRAKKAKSQQKAATAVTPTESSRGLKIVNSRSEYDKAMSALNTVKPVSVVKPKIGQAIAEIIQFPNQDHREQYEIINRYFQSRGEVHVKLMEASLYPIIYTAAQKFNFRFFKLWWDQYKNHPLVARTKQGVIATINFSLANQMPGIGSLITSMQGSVTSQPAQLAGEWNNHVFNLFEEVINEEENKQVILPNSDAGCGAARKLQNFIRCACLLGNAKIIAWLMQKDLPLPYLCAAVAGFDDEQLYLENFNGGVSGKRASVRIANPQLDTITKQFLAHIQAKLDAMKPEELEKILHYFLETKALRVLLQAKLDSYPIQIEKMFNYIVSAEKEYTNDVLEFCLIYFRKLDAKTKNKLAAKWLCNAASRNFFKTVDLLLNEDDVGPNELSDFFKSGNSGETRLLPPLVVATFCESLAVVDRLLESKKTNVNLCLVTIDDATTGNGAGVSVFLSTDRSMSDKVDVHYAAGTRQVHFEQKAISDQAGNSSISGLLLTIPVAAYTGDTALHAAVACNKLDLVGKFIKHPGSNINVRNGLGETPLYLAAAEGFLNIVEYFIQCGAELHHRVRDGYTAREIAEHKQHGKIIIILWHAELKRWLTNALPDVVISEDAFKRIANALYGMHASIIDDEKLILPSNDFLGESEFYSLLQEKGKFLQLSNKDLPNYIQSYAARLHAPAPQAAEQKEPPVSVSIQAKSFSQLQKEIEEWFVQFKENKKSSDAAIRNACGKNTGGKREITEAQVANERVLSEKINILEAEIETLTGRAERSVDDLSKKFAEFKPACEQYAVLARDLNRLAEIILRNAEKQPTTMQTTTAAIAGKIEARQHSKEQEKQKEEEDKQRKQQKREQQKQKRREAQQSTAGAAAGTAIVAAGAAAAGYDAPSRTEPARRAPYRAVYRKPIVPQFSDYICHAIQQRNLLAEQKLLIAILSVPINEANRAALCAERDALLCVCARLMGKDKLNMPKQRNALFHHHKLLKANLKFAEQKELNESLRTLALDLLEKNTQEEFTKTALWKDISDYNIPKADSEDCMEQLTTGQDALRMINVVTDDFRQAGRLGAEHAAGEKELLEAAVWFNKARGSTYVVPYLHKHNSVRVALNYCDQLIDTQNRIAGRTLFDANKMKPNEKIEMLIESGNECRHEPDPTRLSDYPAAMASSPTRAAVAAASVPTVQQGAAAGVNVRPH